MKVWQASEPCSVAEEDSTERHEANSVQHDTDVIIRAPRQQFKSDVHQQFGFVQWPIEPCRQKPLSCKNPPTWFLRCFITSIKEDMIFVVVSLCRLATLCKNFQMDLHEIFREGLQWEQMIKFRWRSGQHLDTGIAFRIRH